MYQSLLSNTKRAKRKKYAAGDDLLEIEYEEDTTDFQADQFEDLELAYSYVFRNGTEIVQKKCPNILRWVHFDIETDSENHYRELLMLFKPWRNEGDLIKTFSSYEQSYISCRDVVENKRKVYAHGAFVMNEIENILFGVEEELNMDFVAPEHEHNETIHEAQSVRLS